jgi:hypothetical protein
MKTLYCKDITPSALRLIRNYEGDVSGSFATVCHYIHEEQSMDRHGNIVADTFKIYFPNNEAISYTLAGEISYVFKRNASSAE